jgi:lipopolysaccharide/colanic/teichoic acid biosynthesis glycosyltransferase
MKYNGFLKRSFDIAVSATLLTALSPVLASLIAINAIYTRKNPIYKATRIGKNKTSFDMLKLRTLADPYDKNGKILSESERKTPFGRLLRYTAFDELPQLINVLKGDMSIVGPRPSNSKSFTLTKDQETELYSVRPGMTGPWQVAVIGTSKKMPEPERLKHELSYIRDGITFRRDLELIFKTPMTMFLGHDGMRPKI